jgi:hypothetical protein
LRFVSGRLDGAVTIAVRDLLGFQNYWKALVKVCLDLIEDRNKLGGAILKNSYVDPVLMRFALSRLCK